MISLRFRIIISTLFIMFLIMTGSYLVIQDIQAGIIEGEFRDRGFLLANNLASEITDPILVNDIMGIRDSIDSLRENYHDIEYIYVVDSQGIILVNTFEGGFPEALQDMSKPSNEMKEYVFDTEKGIIHEFSVPIFKNIGYVHIGVSENRVRLQILDASRKLLLLSLSAMSLGGLFIYFIGRWLTRPILELTEGANRINNGILDQKIQITSQDELGDLARTFNGMAARLNQKITDLVASKEEVETAQKYLETLFNSIEDGIIVINLNHEIIRTNKSFLKMIGMSEREVLGKTCHDLIFKDVATWQEKKECPVNRILETKNPIRIVHETYSDGTKKILELNASFFSDKKNLINIILVSRDITQQKMLEEELVTRNRELTVINEISKSISDTFDLDKLLLQILENLLSLAKMESGEAYIMDENSGNFNLRIHIGINENVSGKTLPHVIKSNDALFLQNMQKTTGTDNHERSVGFLCLDIPLRSKDKVLGIIKLYNSEPRTFSPKYQELFSAIGNQVGVAIQNISFYNNIKYLKDFNEEILNNVNLAIHVIDKDMKILAINKELLNLSRGMFKKEQILNMNLFEAFPILKAKHIDMEYEHVFETGETFMSEEKIEYYGELIFTSTAKIPLKDKNGNVERVITVIKDVSSQKKLEEELKDSYDELKLTYMKLKELFRMKDSFLSNMSHELRTPLTSIMGYTELMLDENITEEQRQKLEIILRNSKRLSMLINRLLDSTLIESSNLQLDIQMLSIYDIAVLAAEDMRGMSSIKNIPVSIEISPSLTIEGDRNRLTQVLSYILDNAIKFTIKGEIKITANEEKDYAHIKISDTGVGIPEDKLKSIFDKFYHLESSDTRKYGGTGLSLWVSKNIIEAHGGKIWAESKNTGSTFHILLPERRMYERERTR
ncbi:MAG: PAS domain S-box protein [Candidatus Methanoperedens sp.]|nr:PAS domain S-box protein [Candidatus Methanoperedens sp.]